MSAEEVGSMKSGSRNMKKVWAICFVIVISFTSLLVFAPTTDALTTTTVYASSDSYTNSSLPTTNYGSTNPLQVWDGPCPPTCVMSFAYFNFSLSQVSLTNLLYANFYIYVATKASTFGSLGFDLVTSSWSEGAITWNTAPTPTAPPGQYTFPIAVGPQYYNMTSFVQSIKAGTGFGIVLSRYTTSTGAITIYSREDATVSRRPALLLTYGPPLPPPTSSLVTIKILTMQDTFVDANNPSTAYCNAGYSTIIVEGQASTNTNKLRGMTQFSLGDVPSNAVIQSATFDVVMDYTLVKLNPGVKQIEVDRITVPWVCSSTTWNSFGGANMLSNVDLQSVYRLQVSNATQTYPQPVRLGITSLAQAWFNRSQPNYGFLVRWSDDSIAPPSGLTFPQEAFNWYSADNIGTSYVPTVTVTYQTPQVTVQPFYYCDGGPCELGVFSGTGLAPWLWKVESSENDGTFKRVNPEFITTNLSTVLRIRVKDFFDNELYNQSKTVTSNPFYWDVGIPYRLAKFSNQRDLITGLSIRPGTGTPIAMDLLPREIWSVPLKSGISYYFNFTLKDEQQVVVSTVSVQRTMNNAVSYIVNGTSITELTVNLDGLTLAVTDLTSLVQPGSLLVGNLPFVPDKEGMVFSATEIVGLSANPFQTLIYEARRSGSNLGSVNLPGPTVAGATFTLLKDDLFLAGSYTRLYINDTKNTTSTTDDTIFLNTTAARTYVALQGRNYTVNMLVCTTCTADRFTQVKLTTQITWRQDLATQQWSYSPSISNSLSVNMTGVFLYVSFIPDIRPEPSTVVVTDQSNGVVLSPGIHYDLSDSGIAMGLVSVATSAGRQFLVTYYQQTNDTRILEPLCTMGQANIGTYNGATYNTVEVSCINQNNFDYVGRAIIQFDSAIDKSTLIVLDSTGARYFNVYWNDQNTLVVQSVSMTKFAVKEFKLYFKYTITSIVPNYIKDNIWLIFIFGVAVFFAGVTITLAPSKREAKQRKTTGTLVTIIGGLWTLVALAAALLL